MLYMLAAGLSHILQLFRTTAQHSAETTWLILCSAIKFPSAAQWCETLMVTPLLKGNTRGWPGKHQTGIVW
jgi:hypothetical protein